MARDIRFGLQLVLILSHAFMQMVYSVEVLYYLILCNEAGIVVCMKARNILPKRFLDNWVALDFGCTGTVLILSVDDQFGAPLHTAHTVADTEGVGASMLQLHTRECQ